MLADTSMKVVLGMSFLTLSCTDIGLQRKILFVQVTQCKNHAFRAPPRGLGLLMERNLQPRRRTKSLVISLMESVFPALRPGLLPSCGTFIISAMPISQRNLGCLQLSVICVCSDTWDLDLLVIWDLSWSPPLYGTYSFC